MTVVVDRLWIDFRLKLDIPCPECGGELHVGRLFVDIEGNVRSPGQCVLCDACHQWWDESQAPNGALKTLEYGAEEWVSSLLDEPYRVETEKKYVSSDLH